MTKLSPQERPESASEVSKIPMPPVNVDIWKLDVQGAGGGSPYVIKTDENVTFSVAVKFYGGSLVDLLMCVGLELKVDFAIEGFGTATETNLAAPPVKTAKGEFVYTPTLSLPNAAGLKPGVYKAAATLTVKPCTPCDEIGPVAFGYISDVVFQVYAH